MLRVPLTDLVMNEAILHRANAKWGLTTHIKLKNCIPGPSASESEILTVTTDIGQVERLKVYEELTEEGTR